jgi:ATP-dependent DNA helicase RecG
MLAEQLEDDRDMRVLPNFGVDDLDSDSLRIYRQMLKDEKPAHPYLELNDVEFLERIKAFRMDRESGKSGLTLAGVLMFGKWGAIQEAVPTYQVDYQERADTKAERRWIDRVVPDGTWSGNVFDFYRKVYRKLTADLKVPFELKGGQRQEDTPIHQALREALVNTLVHADYSGRVSVLVVKRPDMFGFRNPGKLRLPLEQVLQGGESDCRNRFMHQMFLLIGLGERAGSGMPKILSSWRSLHWRQPLLREKEDPEQTLLELHMLDLLPPLVLAELRQAIGSAFDSLLPLDRLILATASIEGTVNHARVLEISNAHPHDLSVSLARLEKKGLLSSQGQSRGKIYFLPGSAPLLPEQVFSGPWVLPSGVGTPISGSAAFSSGQTIGASGQSDSRGARDGSGRLLNPRLDSPVIDQLDALTAAFREQLEAVAGPAKQRKRAGNELMEQVLLQVCAGHYIRLAALAELVGRNPDALRKGHLDRLVQSGRVRLAFRDTPNHKQQAYRAELPDV